MAVTLLACGERRPEVSARELITIRTMGLAYLEENNLTEAEAEFRRLTELAPDEPLGYANLGLALLRQARYDEAAEAIGQAKDLDDSDPEIRLLLAKTFELTDRRADALAELRDAIAAAPEHVKSYYALAELLVGDPSPDASQERAAVLLQLVERAPANVPGRLQLLEVALQNGDVEQGAVQLEAIRQQVPSLPSQSMTFFDDALSAARAGDAPSALAPAQMFHNFMRVTPVYQAGLQEVRGPGGEVIGLPLVTFSQDLSLQPRAEEEILAAISFSDATATAGIEADGPVSAVAVADYDGDGDPDVFLGGPDGGRLLRLDGATFTDVTADAGLRVGAGVRAAVFADDDNDGQLDLYVAGAPSQLYRNQGDGRFADITRAAGLGDGLATAPLFVDGDHDGDLDLLVGVDGRSRLYRNNLDGTFAELSSQWGLVADDVRDAAFGDFDGDDDIDVVVATGSQVRLFDNLRGGRFEEVGDARGLTNVEDATAVAVGDFDSDGFLDVFVGTGAGGGSVLFRNDGTGRLAPDTRPAAMLAGLAGVAVSHAEFLDFDNDGWLDLLVARSDGAGLLLFRNGAPGRFDDMAGMLPNGVPAAATAAAFDYGGDGDLDVLLAGADGVRLLRNDGGDANRFVKVQLVGLGIGSGKNNHFGIGAKLEMRAGALYQVRVVTSPVTHFGLGQRLKADVLRILWTNGVPQNLFYPGSDQDLVETQILKGSCAFLYTWDGERFRFVTDVMWRSALGMPLGIMTAQGGTYAPPQASMEYLRIPRGALVERDGRYDIQLTEELWEVAYIDDVRLVAVDHPADIDVFVNEKFVPPGPASLDIEQVAERRSPVSAIDDRGVDHRETLLAKDDRYVGGFTPGRYQGLTELHDLVLDFGDVPDDASLRLFLRGWIFPTDASINVALAQNTAEQSVAPYLQVLDAQGRWQTVIEDLGFPSGKDKTVIADLRGKFLSADRRVRIRTTMEIYWDEAFLAIDDPRRVVRTTVLEPASADLHFRGFSREYRKGGRYGPHWFDYEDVSTENPWQTIEGAFTRFGDVSPLVGASDDRYVIMAPGDEMTVSFAATAPPLPEGWVRDFLLYSDGWIKDADLNTATGSTVEPLPFHAMPVYPYGANVAVPSGSGVEAYRRTYNTRVISR
jgi:hypothetical protein